MTPGRAPLAPPSAASGLVALAAAAMCFIAALTLGAGYGAAGVAGVWRAAIDDGVVVSIPHAANIDADEQAALALLILHDMEGVESARQAPAEEVERAVAPWLGPDVAYADLAPPLLLVIDPGPGFDPVSTQSTLAAALPGAVLDDLAYWRAPLSRAARIIRVLIWGAAALIAAALAAMVAAAAQASINGAGPTAAALRLLGAEDRRIAHAFERHISGRALLGGVIGAGLGAIGLAALPKLGTQALASAAAPPLWPALILPLAAALIALAAARLTLLRALRRPEE